MSALVVLQPFLELILTHYFAVAVLVYLLAILFVQLAGLVQANLMTSHFSFVGFSLTDPNYLRILYEVRHALNPTFPPSRTTPVY